MSDDRPPEGRAEAPSAADDAAVRRLLAEARHEEPVPAEVAARLDAALAGLDPVRPVAEDGPHDPAVADLASRRRRVRTALVAAAAAVVLGVGVGAVRDRVHVGATSGSADSAASDSGGAARPEGSASSARSGTDASASGAVPGAAGGPAHLSSSLGRPVRLAPDGLARQARHLRPHGPAARAQPGADGATCVRGGFHRARLVPVRYERHPGLLVYRLPTGATQVVDLFLCGQPDAVRSVTLATR